MTNIHVIEGDWVSVTCTQIDGNLTTTLFECFKADVSQGETPAESGLPVSTTHTFHETTGIRRHDGGTYGGLGSNTAGWGQRDAVELSALCRD